MTPRLFYDRLGRPILEDSDGERWLLREESLRLVFLGESGERLHAPAPTGWQHLSAEELEVHRRSARPVDPGEHTAR